MNIIVTGALVGTAVAALLLGADYALLRSGAVHRAERTKGKSALNLVERGRIASAARFYLFVPPAFAAIFWLVWG
jgi:hypothetical protein